MSVLNNVDSQNFISIPVYGQESEVTIDEPRSEVQVSSKQFIGYRKIKKTREFRSDNPKFEPWISKALLMSGYKMKSVCHL